MAQWRKIVASGSDAHLNSVTASQGVVLESLAGGDITLAASQSSASPYSIAFPDTAPSSNQYFAFDGVNYIWTASSATVSTEFIQDAAFGIAIDSSTVNLTYDDTANLFRADIFSSSIANNALVNDEIRIEGTGFTGDASVVLGNTASLAITYGSTTNTAVQGNTTLTIQGTANEVDVTGGSVTLGSGGTVTIGLPNDVVIAGDLTVNGTTTTVNTANLLIEDKFVLFASGSTSATDGGFIVQQSSADVGIAYFYDSATDRFAYQKNLSATASAAIPDSYAGVVEIAASSPSGDPQLGGAANGDGTIHIDSSTGDIWIYA